MEIKRETGCLPSSAEGQEVAVRWYLPENPRAVLQIAHGMAEHSGRYEPLALAFAGQGYAVCAGDHLGHGGSASPEDYGFMAEKRGYHLMARDMHSLTLSAKDRFPGLPVALLGHSMGSFLARYYAMLWSGDIDALMLLGTSGPNPAAAAGELLAELTCLVKGGHYRSRLINSLAFGGYLRRIENPETPFDWLSARRENVEKYVADPACGFLFTAAGFRDLFHLLRAVSRRSAFRAVRKNLPVLLMSGEQDPVGDYGAGVEQVCRLYRRAGLRDLELRLCPGARHEIHNDYCKDEVTACLLRWCGSKLFTHDS